MIDYSEHLDSDNIVTIEQMQRYRKKKRPKKILKQVDLSQVKRFNPDFSEGLDSSEVALRVEQGLYNLPMDVKGKTYGSILFNNLVSVFNFLTFGIAITLILFGAGFSQVFFITIVSSNIMLGVWQEFRAKHIVGKLTLVNAPSATVIRNKSKRNVSIEQIVLDDIIFLVQGKQIPSDAIVVSGEIEVNEAMLTGESVPIKKSVGSTIYSGSFVSSGYCYARVDAVGSANKSEKLAMQAKRYVKPKSELRRGIGRIINVITIVIFPVAGILIGFGIFHNNPVSAIVFSVSGAVIGMVPAGMFLLTSVALFVGQSRLAKKHVLVQDLYCIEMLARVNVLCLDKTGTITDGTMQVKDTVEIKANMPEDFGIKEIISAISAATKDNNQTAMALVDEFGYATPDISRRLRPVNVLPFSSQRKFSAVEFDGQGTFFLGAPEFVLKDMGQRLQERADSYARQGYRVLIVAHSSQEIKGSNLPSNRKAIAVLAIEDHIREDAYDTIKWFKENDVGIRVISGDNPVTVSEVAKRVGINNAHNYISLEGLSDREVQEYANKYTVFGRVTPEQKALLIKSIKSKGNTVAMTGDGVNDILAMRESDCAISVASGSEAARNASHLVLMDSNFGSMPDVVAEGRRVINNIQKSASLFLMKSVMTFGITIVVLFSLTIGGEDAWMRVYPIRTDHLLPLELFVIGIPSTFLALQSNKSIIKGKFLSNVLSQSIPGGLALIINILLLYYFRPQLDILSDDGINIYALQSMMVLTITFTGFIVLLRISQPLDTFRTVLVIGSFLAIMTVVSLLSAQFGITLLPVFMGGGSYGLTFAQTLFLMVTTLMSYGIVSVVMTALRKIKM